MFNGSYASAMHEPERFAGLAIAYSNKFINKCTVNLYYAIDNAK